MENSLRKYSQRPIVQQTSTIKFDAIKKPIIYICQENQFNYTKAESYGYRTLTRFSTGKLEGSDTITWKGKFGNQTYKQLLKELFEYDYTNLIVNSGNSVYKETTAETEKIFNVHEGYCIKLHETRSSIHLQSTTRHVLFLVDPNLANNIILPAGENTKITFGSLGNGFFDGKTFDIEITLNDNKINDGVACNDYDSDGSSFGKCIEKTLGNSMLNWFGCLSPWFPGSANLSCESSNNVKMNETVFDELTKFINGWKMESSNACKQPCQTLKFKLNKITHTTNRINYGYVRCSFNDEVIVHTEVLAYDMFSLVVDLGSSLGLWLGLSAISVVGSFIDFAAFARNVDLKI